MLEDKIPVQIFGQPYEILGDPSQALYYNSLAQYVENKMKEVQQATHIVSTQKIAVLAALNIADELLHEKENKSGASKSLDKKHEDLIRLLSKVMEEPKAESREAAPDKAPKPEKKSPEDLPEFNLLPE